MSTVAAPTPLATGSPRRWRMLRRFVRHPGASAAAVVLATIVILAIVAPWMVPYDWNETDLGPRLTAPNAEFWFGTDLHGRDVFSRVVYGARYSISIGLATVTLSLLAGSFIGIVIGYYGGRLDEWGSRLIDVMLGFPQIVMAILVVSVLGVGLLNVVLAVAIAGVPRFARVVRGAVLVVKEQPFIEAARALGAGDLRIMLRHLLPNAMPTLVVLGTLDLGNAILTTATLSFLGLGAQPPTPEWGAMLNSGREYMRYAPWTMMFPGFALFLVVMAVNLLGDRLSQVLDPRSVDRKS